MEAGMQVVSSSETFNGPGIAGMQSANVIDAPRSKAKAKAKPKIEDDEDDVPVTSQRSEAIPGAFVGLPVQFCTRDGDIIPGILQRQSKANPGVWDVRIFINATQTMPPPRSAPHSETPKPGHWNFIPTA